MNVFKVMKALFLSGRKAHCLMFSSIFSLSRFSIALVFHRVQADEFFHAFFQLL